MDTHEALMNRRSIRKYLKDPVSPASIERIMAAAIWAPSGGNGQPWRFYVATGDRRDELVQALAEAPGPDAPSIEEFDQTTVPTVEEGLRRAGKGDASEAESKKLGEDFQKFNRFGSIRFYQTPVAIVVAKPQAGGSALDIGAAVENLLLAAQAEGLGTCWLGMPLMFKDTIRQILDIPENEDLVTCVCLGHPDNDSPINKMDRSRLPEDQVVHYLD